MTRAQRRKALDPDARPPWTGDDEAMTRWLMHRLNERLREDQVGFKAWQMSPEGQTAEAEQMARDNSVGPAILAAENGDIEPLRKMFPLLAPYLYPPKRKRGGQSSAPLAGLQTKLVYAVVQVPRIRALWRQHYDKKNRRKDETSAEWFAARLWGVTEDEVIAVSKDKRYRQFIDRVWAYTELT